MARSSLDRILGPLISPQFDAFGCPVRGLHTDDTERATCEPCKIDHRAHAAAARCVPLQDDRCGFWGLGLNSYEPWPHTRYFKPGVGLHRDAGPAIASNQVKAWFVDGVCHRQDGPAIEWGDNGRAWIVDGRLHRDGGPAVETNETQEWFRHGRLHRDDGPALFTAPDRHDFAIGGAFVERATVWALWVAGQTEVEPTNKDALSFIDDAVNGTESYSPFAPLDETIVSLALTVHANLGHPVESLPRTDGPTGTQVAVTPPTVVESQRALAHPLSPRRLLPPVATRKPLPYDTATFRHRLAEAAVLGTLRRSDKPRPHPWGVSGSAWGDPYVEADLKLDVDMIAYGVHRPIMRRLMSTSPFDSPVTDDSPVSVPRSRYLLAESARDYARDLASTFASTGGFPVLPELLSPLSEIDDVIERAFEFAAQAIAGGVDDIVARAWATGIVITSGYPMVTLEWGGNRPLSDEFEALEQVHSLASEYYAQALDDLRTHGDATRFMDYVSRCYRWPSDASLTPG